MEKAIHSSLPHRRSLEAQLLRGGSVKHVYLVRTLLECFIGDKAKYPTMSSPREIVDGIYCLVAKIEDDYKVRVAECNNVRKDIITSEYLVRLLAIVPKYSQKD
ncbi:ATPase, V1 complex, subunit C [Trema orientale]|uniref:ATPase, V1 complex, subunit C n=1 Tax=Trema orientale TaxID=63057 RepID=A0A2P5ACU6_TREOI|nr:ATPase, V1 complex, subunit C [Trema orientale]